MKRIIPSLFVYFLAFTFSSQVFAQKDSLKGYTIHIELGGTGMLMSGFVETMLLHKGANAVSIHLGASGWFFKGKPFNDPLLTGFTGGVNYLRGTNNHFLETGFGLTYLMNGDIDKNYSALYLIPRIGFRVYMSNGKFILRCGITPPIHLKSVVKDDFTLAYFPFVGVSLGRFIGR